jgi:hypothetical protein
LKISAIFLPRNRRKFRISWTSDAKPRRSLRGFWKDLNIQITEEDIAEARREMQGAFRKTSPDGGRPRHGFGYLISA